MTVIELHAALSALIEQGHGELLALCRGSITFERIRSVSLEDNLYGEDLVVLVE